MRNILYILGELSDEDIEWMARTGERQRLAANTTLIEKGKPVKGLYIIIDGELAVVAGENDRVITQLGQGEIIGEMSFVESSLPSVSVKTLGPVLLLALPREKLQMRLKQKVDFAARLYRALTLLLSHRLRVTTSQLGYSDTAELGIVDPSDPDELSADVLDNVYLAGTRFEALMDRLRNG